MISQSACLLYRSDLRKVPVPEPTETKLNSFYKDLFDHGCPAILSIVPEYSDAYVSHQAEKLSPPPSDHKSENH